MITLKEFQDKFFVRTSYLTAGKKKDSDVLEAICESESKELPEEALKMINATFVEFKTIQVVTTSVLSEIDEPRIQLIS